MTRAGAALASLRRPYRIPAALPVFVAIPPLYIFIAQLIRERGVAYAPELAIDRAIPLQPAWAIVYGCLYLFLILLPIFVVREPLHLRRTLYAYMTVWLTAYVVFWVYPTYAPRPQGEAVAGAGFPAWALRALYGMDPPYNCFPSIHVGHSFVSAITLCRVHRRLGAASVIAAGLVGLSTLFVKQHYVLDVVAGAALAGAGGALFLRIGSRETVAEIDRRLAPVFAAWILGATVLIAAGFWIAYLLGL
jgi:membrane-associated phospholipid phosphatase